MRDRQPLKLWVMTNEYHPDIIGGLGIVATQLTRSLVRAGASATVIVTGSSSRLVVSKAGRGLQIVRLPNSPRYYHGASGTYRASAVLEAAAKAGAVVPDIIHVHSTEFAAAAAEAGRKYDVPIVYTCHSISSAGLRSREGRRQTRLIRTAARIAAPSWWQAGQIGGRYPGARTRIAVIPNGVQRVSGKVRGPSPRLLYAGRIIPSKGIEELIRAVGRLSRQSRDVRLTVIGDGPPVYHRRMRILARRLGIAGRIRWLRHQSHAALQRRFAAYGAVIVPSRQESFCLVALEAMARSVPLVSTISGGLQEFVNSRNAEVIRSIDEAEIARAVAAMRDRPDQTRQRSVRARMTASRYLWPVIARRYSSLFASLRKRR